MYKIKMYVNPERTLYIYLWGIFSSVESAKKEIRTRHARVADLCVIVRARTY